MTQNASHYLVAVGLSYVEVLAALHGESFDEGWSASSFDSALRIPGTYGYLVLREEEDAPLGFVLFRATKFSDGGGEAEVLTIATRPTERGQGVARTLMMQGLDLAGDMGVETMFLEVATDNAPAIGLYQALGFCETGRRKGYYAGSDGTSVDALVMAFHAPGCSSSE